jgi:hypothetical protein
VFGERDPERRTEGQPPVVTGFDISLIRDGVIAKLYTVLTLPER